MECSISLFSQIIPSIHPISSHLTAISLGLVPVESPHEYPCLQGISEHVQQDLEPAPHPGDVLQISHNAHPGLGDIISGPAPEAPHMNTNHLRSLQEL